MNTLVKKFIYNGIGLLSSGCFFRNVFATTPDNTFGTNEAETLTNNLESGDLEDAIQKYVNYFMTFLYLVAVLYALWGGFQILTAGGDDEKVKNGKTILIQGGIGLLVIWLAGTIVKWVLRLLVGATGQ